MELPNYGEVYTVLNGRYALMECLAESASGNIYRGRDLDKIRDNGLASQVLIHVLPPTLALSVHSIFQQIQQACAGLSATAGVLPACAYGEDAATAYIVLESPVCAGTQSLSRASNPRAASGVVVAQRLVSLLKRHALPKQLDPALLLSTPEQQVYVLATAFSPAIQALVQVKQYGVSAVGQHYLRRLSVGVSLAALMVFSAVTAHALMKQVAPANSASLNSPISSLPVAPPPSAQPRAVQMPVSASKPASADTGRVAEPQPSPAPLEKVVTPKAAPATLASATQPAPVQPPVISKAAAPVTEAVLQPAVKAKPAAVVEATLPEPAPLMEQVVVVDDTPAQINNTIQQAYRALQAGQLSDAPQGALRFARELRELAPEHPQVARLGQEITAAYLRHIRAALQAHDLEEVARLLPVTRQLIAEFQLGHLEAAQQVLENKLVELNG